MHDPDNQHYEQTVKALKGAPAVVIDCYTGDVFNLPADWCDSVIDDALDQIVGGAVTFLGRKGFRARAIKRAYDRALRIDLLDHDDRAFYAMAEGRTTP